MKNITGIAIFLKQILFMMICVAVTNCSPEEEVVAQSPAQAVAAEVPASEVPTVTISGSYTEVTDDGDCAACTLVVPEGTTVVDGKELGIKPGSVVCLKKSAKSVSVEFVNVEGTAEHPVIISYCGE